MIDAVSPAFDPDAGAAGSALPLANPSIRGVGAASSTARHQRDDGGASPTTPLHLSPRDLELRVVPTSVAAEIIIKNHYLHAMAAGLRLCFGIFVGDRMLGAIVLNAGPVGGPKLVEGATTHDCLTLARLWLDDALPRNSESRALGLLVRALRRHTAVKFLLSYADPCAGHVGYVYQAANWLYTGLAENQPLMDLGDGIPRHLRSVGSTFGTHSAAYFRRRGLSVRFIPLQAKHRYVYFVDRAWRERLRVPVLPYPKKGVVTDGDHGSPARTAPRGSVEPERGGRGDPPPAGRVHRPVRNRPAARGPAAGRRL